MVDEARTLDAAIASTLADGVFTADIAGTSDKVTTGGMTDAILARLERLS
jgi:isocitrate dehydrogenase